MSDEEDHEDESINRPITGDFRDIVVVETVVYDAQGEPRIGVMALTTPVGHYEFMLVEPIAKDLIKQLQAFMKKKAERLP
jgi:hypothetical protein